MSGIDSFTKICLHCDGTDGSTSFPDASASAHTVTAVGNAQVDTAQSVFGGASGLFDGSGDRLTIPYSTDFDLGSGDWVIDFRVRYVSLATSQTIIDLRDGVEVCPRIISTTDHMKFDTSEGAGVVIDSGATLAVDTWYHFAVVKSSGTTRMFKDGVQVGSDYTDSFDYKANTSGIAIGANIGGGADLNGWLDEFRVSKGTDRGWSGGFTPPTAAYSEDAADPGSYLHPRFVESRFLHSRLLRVG